MKNIAVIIICILFFMAVPVKESASAEPARFTLDLGGWLATVNATSQSGKGAGNIDIMGNLGLDDKKTVFPVSVTLNMGGPINLFGDFYSFSISGDRVLSESLTYNGQTFAASTAIKGKFEQSSIKAGVKYRMQSQQNTDIYLIGGFLFQQIKLNMSNAATSVSDSLDIPFPFLGIEMENRSGNISWGGSVQGMVFTFQDYDTTYFDMALFMKYFITENLSIKGAYHYEDIDSEKDFVNFDTSLGGVFLGVSYRQ